MKVPHRAVKLELRTLAVALNILVEDNLMESMPGKCMHLCENPE